MAGKKKTGKTSSVFPATKKTLFNKTAQDVARVKGMVGIYSDAAATPINLDAPAPPLAPPALVLNAAAEAALYEGTDYAKDPQSYQESTKAREAFMDFLEKRLSQGKPSECKVPADVIKNDPDSAAMSMYDLLGGNALYSEGVSLYKAALKEEVNSKAYMDALRDKSTQHRPGKKWLTTPEVIVAGPSSSGKSYAAEAALQQADRETDKDPNDDSGNHVITVDGGNAREVSQMRKVVIEIANRRGYSGISDLHKHSKVLEKAKKRIKKMALAETKAAIVIPHTFSDLVSIHSLFKALRKRTNSKIFFTRVEGENPQDFADVVEFLGSRRAYKTTGLGKDIEIDLNNNEGVPESKAYGKSGFEPGRLGSILAEWFFLSLNPANRSYVIANDLIRFKKIPGTSKWKKLEGPRSPNDEVMVVSRRVYEKWRAQDYLYQPDKQQLPGAEPQSDDILTIWFNKDTKQYEETTLEIIQQDVRRKIEERFQEDSYDFVEKQVTTALDELKIIRVRRDFWNETWIDKTKPPILSLAEYSKKYPLLPEIHNALWFQVKMASRNFVNTLRTDASNFPNKQLIDGMCGELLDHIDELENGTDRINDLKASLAHLEQQHMPPACRDALKQLDEAFKQAEQDIADRLQTERMKIKIGQLDTAERETGTFFQRHYPLIRDVAIGFGVGLLALGAMIGAAAVASATFGLAFVPLVVGIASFAGVLPAITGFAAGLSGFLWRKRETQNLIEETVGKIHVDGDKIHVDVDKIHVDVDIDKLVNKIGNMEAHYGQPQADLPASCSFAHTLGILQDAEKKTSKSQKKAIDNALESDESDESEKLVSSEVENPWPSLESSGSSTLSEQEQKPMRKVPAEVVRDLEIEERGGFSPPRQ